MLVRVVPRLLALVVTLCFVGPSLVATSARADTVVYADNDPSALVVWRDQLDPYGAWVTDERYGVVWVPHSAAVGADFAPYVSSGRWALSDEGDWVWVSDYPFGGVVFHYGRWVWTSAHGWVWIPGLEYAPAWVVWRVPSSGYAYVGWAPAPPSYVWFDGVAVAVWYRPVTPYVFCHTHHVFSYGVHRHIVVDRTRIHHIGRHTVRYRPSGSRRGPTMTEARVASRDVPRIRQAARPVPHVAAASSDRHAAAPAPRRSVRSEGAAAGERHAARPSPSDADRTAAPERSASPSVRPVAAGSSVTSESTPAAARPRASRPAPGDAAPSSTTRVADGEAQPQPVRARPQPRSSGESTAARVSTGNTEVQPDASSRARPVRPAPSAAPARSNVPSAASRPVPARSRVTQASPAAPTRRAPAPRAAPAPRRAVPAAPRRR